MRGFFVFWLCCWSTVLWAQGTDFFFTPKPEPPVPPPVVTPEAPPPPKPEPLPEPPPAPPPVPEAVEPPSTSISDVIFLLDTSGSMDAFLSGQRQSKLSAAQEALDFFARRMQPGTRFQLWTFDSRVRQLPNSPEAPASREVVFEVIGPEGSAVRKHLQQQIAGLETRGGTNLYQAVHQAIRHFDSSTYQVPEKAIRKQIVVVLADGQDDNLSGFTLQQVLQARQRFPEVQVRTIGFGVTQSDPLQQVLCQIAGSAEACTLARSAEDLTQIIQSFTES